MNDNSEMLCDQAMNAFADGYLKTVYSIQAIVCLSLIPCAIVLGIAIGKTTVLHRNVRICLVSLTLATIITNVGTVIIAGYHLVAVCSSKEKFCDLIVMTRKECMKIEVTRNIGAVSTVGGLFLLAVERICATVQFKTYENNGSATVGIGLALVQWLLATPTLIGLLMPSRIYPGREISYPYCNGVAIQPHLSSVYFFIMLAAQILGLFIFIVLAVVNKQKMNQYTFNHALRLLSVRYQLKENVRTTKFMIPISASSCLVFGVTLVALLICAGHLPSYNGEQITENIAVEQIHFARVMEVVSLSSPAFTITFIAVVIRYSSYIRQNIKAMFGRVKLPRRISRVGDQALGLQPASDRYFDALKKQWEMPTVK